MDIENLPRDHLIKHTADCLNSLDENGAIAAILKGCDPVCIDELVARLEEWLEEPHRRSEIMEILLQEL